MKRQRIEVEVAVRGMTCDSCRRHVEESLGEVPGVESVLIANWKDGKAKVVTDQDVSGKDLVQAVEKAGYSADIHDRKTIMEDEPRSGKYDYDLVIVGGGSAAFSAAIRASELGARAVIINEGLPIGGTCVNVGCVPSKTLIRAAEEVHCASHARFRGIQAAARVSDAAALFDQKRELVNELRGKKYVDIVSGDPNITILEGRGTVTGEHTVEVNGRSITARRILVATGASPFVPDIPGLAESGYLTNETAYELDEIPEKLIVLGGRYIALETAQMFARLGSRVTVLQRSERILPDEGEDLTEALTGYLRKEGIDIRTGVQIESVGREGTMIRVKARISGMEETIEGNHVFVATGRRGNASGLGLEKVGVVVGSGGYLPVDEFLRTSSSSIFGAGDVIGSPMFVYTAAYEGALAAENALAGDNMRARDYSALPWVIFTDPQVAGVGLDERQAKEKGIDVDTSTLSMDLLPRALAAFDTRGFIKLIRNTASDRLVGARILAPEGGELLMEISLAIRYDIPVSELAARFHPYLTLSEAVKLAAIGFTRDVKTLSCCAG